MKRTTAKSFSRSLTNALLRGLAVFAVFGAAVYAYAAITYPAVQPNPVSGVVGLYVGKTAGTYDGAGAGSYENANNFCANGGGALTDSHVCTPMEMINTYNHNPSELAGETDPLWLNSGAPAYYSSVSNDCLGWTTNGKFYGSPVYGSVWQSSGKYGMMTFCSVSLKYACCK